MPTDYRTAHLTIEEKDRRDDLAAAIRDYWDDREAEMDAELAAELDEARIAYQVSP